MNLRKIFFAVLILASTGFTQNNSGTINGFVYDADNGEVLIGANVYIKEINLGAGTNISGYFVITNVPAGDHQISFSYIGYKTQVKKINLKSGENEYLKIYLKPDTVKLSEIVTSADSIRTIEKLYAKPLSSIELNARQINSIPKVVEADLLRSLQTLPGIQPLSDFSSALYIRGGTPDQNLYQLDGTDIYNPEHAFGLFSTFNTAAIKKIELSKGGFGAEYGGRLSSVLSVTNIDGNRNRFQGEANISAISASTTLQSPLGNFGSISGSFRRTYIDQTYAQFVDQIPDYYFYDGNLKAFFDLGDNDKLILSFFGGLDRLDFVFDKSVPNSPSFLYKWGNQTGSINYKKIFTPRMFGNFFITGSRFFSNFDFNVTEFSENNMISDITLKANMEYIFSRSFGFKFGLETKFLYGELISRFPTARIDGKRHLRHYIGYVTSNWKPFDAMEIETGLRFDYFDSEVDYNNLDPRFSVKYRVNDLTSIKFATGIYHQYVERIPRLFLTSIWLSADDFIQGSSAYHFVLGLQREIAQIYELEVDVYYKKYNSVYSYNQTFLTETEVSYYDENNLPVYASTKGLFNRGDGFSYGLEILLRKDYGAISGWWGASLSRTENKVDGLNQNKLFIPRHDRTLTLNSVFNINIEEFISELKGSLYERGTSSWMAGINFVFSTGQPITLPASVYSTKYLPDWDTNPNNVSLYPTVLNSVRLPEYIRLDLSITYEKNYGSWTLSPYLQIFNITNRKNVWFIEYNNKIKEGVVTQEIKPVYMFPILPSFGVTIKF